MREALLRFGAYTPRCLLVVEKPANILSLNGALIQPHGAVYSVPKGVLLGR